MTEESLIPTIYPDTKPSDDDVYVSEIRIILNSGAYVQSWFRKLEFRQDAFTEEFRILNIELVNVHEYQDSIIRLDGIKSSNIDAIITMRTIPEQTLYNLLQKPI